MRGGRLLDRTCVVAMGGDEGGIVGVGAFGRRR